MHPLLVALLAAAHGEFPPVDGVIEVHAPGIDGTQGVVEFTGHAFVLTDRDPDAVRHRARDAFGGATDVDFMRWLAGPNGTVGSHDALLVAHGTGVPPPSASSSKSPAPSRPFQERTDLDDHPRVVRARHHRTGVRVFGNDDGLATLGSGVVGRTELSVELFDGDHARGAGRRIIANALGHVEQGEPVWAQVAPGNAASLRAFLSCGFVPVGAERLVGDVVVTAHPPTTPPD